MFLELLLPCFLTSEPVGATARDRARPRAKVGTRVRAEVGIRARSSFSVRHSLDSVVRHHRNVDRLSFPFVSLQSCSSTQIEHVLVCNRSLRKRGAVVVQAGRVRLCCRQAPSDDGTYTGPVKGCR